MRIGNNFQPLIESGQQPAISADEQTSGSQSTDTIENSSEATAFDKATVSGGTVLTDEDPPGTVLTDEDPPGTVLTDEDPPGTVLTDEDPPGTVLTDEDPPGTVLTDEDPPGTVLTDEDPPGTVLTDEDPPGTILTDEDPPESPESTSSQGSEPQSSSGDGVSDPDATGSDDGDADATGTEGTDTDAGDVPQDDSDDETAYIAWGEAGSLDYGSVPPEQHGVEKSVTTESGFRSGYKTESFGEAIANPNNVVRNISYVDLGWKMDNVGGVTDGSRPDMEDSSTRETPYQGLGYGVIDSTPEVDDYSAFSGEVRTFGPGGDIVNPDNPIEDARPDGGPPSTDPQSHDA